MEPLFAQWVIPFMAAIPRIAAIFIVLPIFGPRTVRGIVRSEFILVLAMFIAPSVQPESAQLPQGLVYGLFVIKEALLGVTIGFFLGALFWIAQNVGFLIDLQTGTQNGMIFDPTTEREEGPTSSFMLQFIIALLMAGGGFLTLLDIIFESYVTWPVFQMAPNLNMGFADLIAGRMDTMFAMTVRFAAPIIILLALIELGLGLMNRFAEGFDVYSLAMPIKSMTAFFVLMVFLSFVYDSLAGLLHADGQALQLLKALLRGPAEGS